MMAPGWRPASLGLDRGCYSWTPTMGTKRSGHPRRALRAHCPILRVQTSKPTPRFEAARTLWANLLELLHRNQGLSSRNIKCWSEGAPTMSPRFSSIDLPFFLGIKFCPGDSWVERFPYLLLHVFQTHPCAWVLGEFRLNLRPLT